MPVILRPLEAFPRRFLTSAITTFYEVVYKIRFSHSLLHKIGASAPSSRLAITSNAKDNLYKMQYTKRSIASKQVLTKFVGLYGSWLHI